MYGDCDVLVGNGMGGNLDSLMSSSSLLAAQRLIPQLPSSMHLQSQGIFSSSSDGLSLAPPNGVRERNQMNENSMMLKSKEDEHESKSGSGHMEGGSGEDQDADQQHTGRKRYHRHTARQIQEMEALFKECPHPDDKQRQRLSIELGLKPRQVKFWFQNRRTQMKAQQDRHDNTVLRVENENLRSENLSLREAVKNIICPSCGGPALVGEIAYSEQHLRLENNRLKEELERVTVIASKYLGRSIPALAPNPLTTAPGLLSSSLDLGMGNFGKQNLLHSSDILTCPPLSDVAVGSANFMDIDKSLALDLAITCTEELIQMVQTNEPLWIRIGNGMKEVLDLEEYGKISPWGKHSTHLRTEATRDSTNVIMNGVTLVEAFMDASKWTDMFPCIVTRAKTLQVLSPGVPGHRNGSLQLMYAELQVLSPLVSTREIQFLRYCNQRVDGSWVVVDFSLEGLHGNPSPSSVRYRKRPSGCVIQDRPNGYSKVTWVEHAEVEDRVVHRMYQQLINSGMAFGAQRWVATLQRQCERLASLMASNISAAELGVIPSAAGRRSMMKLAQRMTNTFCANVSASNSHDWTTISGSSDENVRITTRKSTEPGQPSGVVLCVATSVWLPVSPQRVFDFLKDEEKRPQWDVLCSGNNVQEVAHMANGSHPGNCISLLRVSAGNTSQNVELILQESCTDASGSIIVYAPVDVPAIHTAMTGEDPSYIALLPSGVAILPDGPSGNQRTSSLHESTGSNNVCDSPRTGGSMLTLAFQVLGSTLPTAKVNMESIATINNLTCNTVQQIKAALHCADV